MYFDCFFFLFLTFVFLCEESLRTKGKCLWIGSKTRQMPRNKAKAAESTAASSKTHQHQPQHQNINSTNTVLSLGLTMLVSSGYTPLPSRIAAATPARLLKRQQKVRQLRAATAMPFPLHETITSWASRHDGCAAVHRAGLLPAAENVDENAEAEPKTETEPTISTSLSQPVSHARVNVGELLQMRNWVLRLVATNPPDSASPSDVALLRGLLLGSSGVNRTEEDSMMNPQSLQKTGAAAVSSRGSNKRAAKKTDDDASVDVSTCGWTVLFEKAKQQVDEVLDPFLKKHGWL